MINPIERIMRTSPVIPVLVSNDVGEARELAEALIEGGLKVLEVTLRTPNALQVIRRMKLVRGGIVGAGTVLNHKQAEEAASAGAEFFVSPGLTEPLAVSAHKLGVPLLPGVATAGDIEATVFGQRRAGQPGRCDRGDGQSAQHLARHWIPSSPHSLCPIAGVEAGFPPGVTPRCRV